MMKNRTPVTLVIKIEILDRFKLTMGKAADILQVRRATLSRLANGKSALSPEMALRMEKAFGVDMHLLLRMQADYDAAQMRLRSDEIQVSAYGPRP